jgi:pimeloyl-ACP methyl ester carboxylesterase
VVPALIVWDDADKIMPPANAALWRERLPDARRHDEGIDQEDHVHALHRYRSHEPIS